MGYIREKCPDRITKPLLYQLSYTGAVANVAAGGLRGQEFSDQSDMSGFYALHLMYLNAYLSGLSVGAYWRHRRVMKVVNKQKKPPDQQAEA